MPDKMEWYWRVSVQLAQLLFEWGYAEIGFYQEEILYEPSVFTVQ